MQVTRWMSGVCALWLLAGAVVVSIAMAGASWAETHFVSPPQQTAMIELYTSEGCSSCPPADQWLSGFKQHPDLWQKIIPIAFHVDYWDYIGWKDRFALKQYGERQYLHRVQGNIKQVYTPGLVLNGKEWRGWFRGKKKISTDTETTGVLSLTLNDETFTAQFSPRNLTKKETDPPTFLTIALLGFDLETAIRAGENKGETLNHDFVVLAMKSYENTVGQWQGSIPRLGANENVTQKKAVVAWASYADNIKPVQAVGGWY